MPLDLLTVQPALTAETHALSVTRPRLGPVAGLCGRIHHAGASAPV